MKTKSNITWRSLIVEIDGVPNVYDLDQHEKLKKKFQRPKNRTNLTNKYKPFGLDFRWIKFIRMGKGTKQEKSNHQNCISNSNQNDLSQNISDEFHITNTKTKSNTLEPNFLEDIFDSTILNMDEKDFFDPFCDTFYNDYLDQME